MGPEWSICPKQKLFWKILASFLSTYWPLSLCKVLKFFSQQIQSYDDAPFLGPKWPICPNKNFSENLLISIVPPFIPIYMPKIKARYQSINEILTIKEYWNLIGRETFRAITWETDFSQACSFHRMSMKLSFYINSRQI